MMETRQNNEELLKLKQINDNTEEEISFSYFRAKYDEMMQLLPKDNESILREKKETLKENKRKAEDIYKTVFLENKKNPIAQYFMICANKFKSIPNGIYYYKKKLHHNPAAINFLNLGVAKYIRYSDNYRALATTNFVIVLLLEKNINSDVSKEAIGHLRRIAKECSNDYRGDRAELYLSMFLSTNLSNHLSSCSCFRCNYLHDGHDKYIVQFFNDYKEFIKESERIAILNLLDDAKNKFIQRMKEIKQKEVNKPIKETDKTLPPAKEASESSSMTEITSNLPTLLSSHSLFAKSDAAKMETKSSFEEEVKLKIEILNKKHEILEKQKELLALETRLLELQQQSVLHRSQIM